MIEIWRISYFLFILTLLSRCLLNSVVQPELSTPSLLNHFVLSVPFDQEHQREKQCIACFDLIGPTVCILI